MQILIVEDEDRIARRIERFLTDFFHDLSIKIHKEEEIDSALAIIESQSIDLLCLDLNLHGENGFEILKSLLAEKFHTIVISAYAERAIEAFEFGVLDFIAKPFSQERLEKALMRYQNAEKKSDHHSRYLAIKHQSLLNLIDVEKIVYIKGAGPYSELHLDDGKVELHSKNLDKLDTLLADNFQRNHKSYIANLNKVEHLRTEAGSKYTLCFKNKAEIPVGRSYYKVFKEKL